MLETLEEVRWERFARPPGSPEGEVPASLRALADATPETVTAAYHRLLYAVGNNHAGTYYPVVLAVLPFLREVLRSHNASARGGALDVLIDLSASFGPHPGFEQVETPQGPRPVQALLVEYVLGLFDEVEHLSVEDRAPEVAKLARELLRTLEALRDDGAGTPA